MSNRPLLDCGGQLWGYWWVGVSVRASSHVKGGLEQAMPSTPEVAEAPPDSDNDNIDKRHKAERDGVRLPPSARRRHCMITELNERLDGLTAEARRSHRPHAATFTTLNRRWDLIAAE